MEILWKGTVSAEFWGNRPKLCGNCAFSQNYVKLRYFLQGKFVDFGKIVTEFSIIKPCRYKRLRYVYLKKVTLHYFFCYYLFIFTPFSLCEKCPYLDFFWSIFWLIRTEYRDLRCKSSYSVEMRKITDRNNFKDLHFLRSVSFVSPDQLLYTP